jgi:hypothetical protein
LKNNQLTSGKIPRISGTGQNSEVTLSGEAKREASVRTEPHPSSGFLAVLVPMNSANPFHFAWRGQG